MASFSFRAVAPCLFAIFIDILGFGLVAPLLITLFTSDRNMFGISSHLRCYIFLGTSLALYPLMMFFGSSFIGDLSDSIGRKKTLIFSMLGMTFGFLLLGVGVLISNLALFMIGRGVSGLVAASQSVALATISDLSTKENKAIHLSYIALIQCLGFILGPLLGGVLSDVKFCIPFFTASGFALVAALWIFVSFQETFIKKSKIIIDFTRIYRVFSEAYHHPRIRHLSLTFLFMQMAVALYLPIILIIWSTKFDYSSLSLGFFNGYLGVCFAMGLLLFLPRLLKRLKIEQIVYLMLLVGFLVQLLSSILPLQLVLWLLAFPFAVATQIAFSGMFTSYSNATNASKQGWAMGISVSIMAIAWAIAGLSAQLVPIIGASSLMLLGSFCMGLSAFFMRKYCLRYSTKI